MLLNLSHKNLKAWQLSKQLQSEVRTITKQLPKDEEFVLRIQIRRAALSVLNNIAEGAARKTNAEKRRFYEISRSSLVEVDTDFEAMLELGYVKENEIEKTGKMLNEIFAMLSGMMTKLS
ncbi:MAG: four helix bundle protein [Chitinophagaceae bacterium]|nr:four helix bundle protein [Chitinophagaceae bacterium]